MRACTKCGEVKPLDRFPPIRRGKPKLQSWCRDCFAAYGIEYYRKNRDVQKARLLRNTRARRRDNQIRMIEYLLAHPCVDCGETDIVVLQFDHLGNKERDVARMINGGWTWPAIETEIAKCEVRCANCHRLVTARRYTTGVVGVPEPPNPSPEQLLLADGRSRVCRVCKESKPLSSFPYRSRERDTRHTICLLCQREVTRAWYLRQSPNARQFVGYGTKIRETLASRIDAYLNEHPCVDCGESNPLLLDFDHLGDKIDDVANMVVAARPWEEIENEIGKCEVCCANCHARRTARRIRSYKMANLTVARAALLGPAASTSTTFETNAPT